MAVSAQYSVTIRVELDARQEPLGKLTAAIAEAGGQLQSVDLVPGERVVQAVDFESDDPSMAGTMTMTWRATAAGGGTRVDIVAEDVPDGISAAGRHVQMTALMDTPVLISNCPQLNNPCNAYNPTPIRVMTWDPA